VNTPSEALRVISLDDDATRTVIEPNGQQLPAGGRVLVFAPSPDGVSGRQRREVVVDGWRFELEIEPERRALLRERARRGASQSGTTARLDVRAVIPGRVVAVAVNAGDAVEAGDRLLVIEAMKMQNDVRAPRAGRIARVAVGAGQTVELRDVLVEIE